MLTTVIVRLHNARKILNQYVLWEMSSGLSALLWGLWVLYPGVPIKSTAQTLMAQIAAEHIWGLVYLVTGALQLWGSTNGYRGARLISAIIACGLWWAYMALLFISSQGSTGVPVYFVLGLTQAICSVFLSLKE
jgi:hypothetical protein